MDIKFLLNEQDVPAQTTERNLNRSPFHHMVRSNSAIQHHLDNLQDDSSVASATSSNKRRRLDARNVQSQAHANSKNGTKSAKMDSQSSDQAVSMHLEGLDLKHPGLYPGCKIEAIKPDSMGTWHAARIVQFGLFPMSYLSRQTIAGESPEETENVTMMFLHYEGFPSIDDSWVSPAMIRAIASDDSDSESTSASQPSSSNKLSNTFLRYGPRGEEIEAGWKEFAKYHRQNMAKDHAKLRTGSIWAGLGHGCPCCRTGKVEPVKAGVGRHPERSERVNRIVSEWQRRGLLRYLSYIPRRQALREELALAHGETHLRNYFVKLDLEGIPSTELTHAGAPKPKPPLANANSTSVTAGEVPYESNGAHQPAGVGGVAPSTAETNAVKAEGPHPPEVMEDPTIWPPTLTSKLACGNLGTAVDTTFDPDKSPEECRTSVGSLLNLVDSVITGRVANGFAAIRPPGHHAEPDQAMGFCIYNNVAVACEWALRNHRKSVRRILIIDWDVHHGNGTESAFYDREEVLYVSLHRYDHGEFYPFTGDINRCGEGAGRGRNVNVGWSKASDRNDRMGDTEYLAAMYHVVLPIAREFNPDLVFISAGFDLVEGHSDGLGGYRVTPLGLSLMTRLVTSLAKGKVIMVLEGGYELSPLANAATACIQEMIAASSKDVAATDFLQSLATVRPNISAQQSLTDIVMVQRQYWQCMTKLAMSVTSLGPQHLSLPVGWRIAKFVANNSNYSKSDTVKDRRRRRLTIEGY